MSGFFEELKRRKVYKVAAAYIVAAGFIIQIASAVFPAWDLPNWSQRLMIALILAGFPIALIFAWIFDITASGIERTSVADPRPGATPARRRRNVILLAISGLAVSAAAGFFVLPRATAHKIDKSIAVLPFENFSDDKENAYFADGVQDDILTNLSKIGDLKVISRTSVMGYRGEKKNVREIGKALGVANVLEGSVRRAGNKVRVNVQLIDATTDEHLWAEDYDGDLTDVFKIQTDLARQIADNLQARLSPKEKAQLQQRPTENNEAYVEFVKAHDLSCAYEDIDKLKESEQHYEKAIQLDPKFALAFAAYSQLESWILHSYDSSPARREKARALADRALELQPDLPEARLALGFCLYYGDRDYEGALKEFLAAQKGLPNNADSFLAVGAIQRRQGRWEESSVNLEKAAALNPKDSFALQNLAFNYEMRRDYDAANKTLDRGLQINPAGFGLWEIKARVAIESKGDFSVAEKGLAEIDKLPSGPEKDIKVAQGRISMELLRRNYGEAAKAAESLADDTMAKYPGALCQKYTLIGTARKAGGDAAGAQTAFVKAKQLAEDQVRQSPNDASGHAQLAEVLAWLGEKEAAIAEVSQAMKLLPESKDAFEGPDMTTSAATVYTLVGDHDHAIDLLEGLLQRPSLITTEMLKLNPLWDPLRNNPRFQALLSKYAKA